MTPMAVGPNMLLMALVVVVTGFQACLGFTTHPSAAAAAARMPLSFSSSSSLPSSIVRRTLSKEDTSVRAGVWHRQQHGGFRNSILLQAHQAASNNKSSSGSSSSSSGENEKDGDMRPFSCQFQGTNVPRRDVLSLLMATGPSAASLAACGSMFQSTTTEPANAAAPLQQQQQIITETSSVSRGSSPSGNQLTSYNPEIPFSSFCQYKITKLSNGLSVLLVNDRRAYRASVALTVAGAGQWADPVSLPGLAHLMEHMILSFNSRSTFSMTSRDFEEWLAENAGASNGFTAYDKVCFHFSCPEAVLAAALQRFAGLFGQEAVEQICCRDPAALQREVRRVNAELDLDWIKNQVTYLTKDFVNPEHPYSRFSAGNLETLETIPNAVGINVGARLMSFFQKHYLASQAVLVVIAGQQQDLYALERMVAAPFSSTFSRSSSYCSKPNRSAAATAAREGKRTRNHGSISPAVISAAGHPAARSYYYPGAFLQGSRYKQLVLYRSKGGDATNEEISFQWTLGLDYRDRTTTTTTPLITATQVAFVLARMLGRRGPGGLYLFLLRRGWVPANAIPRTSVPVDVSGFQIIKVVVPVTVDGLINRSSVVSAFYDYLDTLRRDKNGNQNHNNNAFVVSRGLITQYAAVAKLHGYILAARPPDAIELAMDAQLYGLGGLNGVGTGKWYRFPDNRNEISALQKAVTATLVQMSNPNTAVVIATAGSQALVQSQLLRNNRDDAIPPLLSPKWQTHPFTGARFYFEDMLRASSRVEKLVLSRIVDRNELSPPVINPLIPAMIRPTRIVREVTGTTTNANELLLFRTANEELDAERLLRFSSSSSRRRQDNDSWWEILEPVPGQIGLSLPRGPPELTCRCAFVMQFLSSRPVRADVRQAAQAQLWKISFEDAVQDLAELGFPGALAYELSFNKYGLRLSVLGISQTLPSYTRRLVRRLVEHHFNLLQGPEYLNGKITAAAVANAERVSSPNVWPTQRKRRIISNLRRSSAYEAATEGNAFLRSCTGVMSFAQGDLLGTEVRDLVEDLKQTLAPALAPSLVIAAGRRPAGSSSSSLSATPSIDELLYKPFWKPRSASPCSVSGVSLVSDACGRIPR